MHSPTQPQILNVPITARDVSDIVQKFTGQPYEVRDISRFQEAFVHDSYVKGPDVQPGLPGSLPLQPRSYQLLEWGGDTIIHFILTQYLLDRYCPSNDTQTPQEGELTNLRATMECNKQLAALSRQLGFERFVVIQPGLTDVKQTRYSVDVLADVFEAFIQALYRDCNRDILGLVTTFVINIMETYFDFADYWTTDRNFKGRFQETTHKLYGWTPKFKVLDVERTPKTRVFTSAVVGPANGRSWSAADPGRVFGVGKHEEKTESEQLACKAALEALQRQGVQTK